MSEYGNDLGCVVREARGVGVPYFARGVDIAN